MKQVFLNIRLRDSAALKKVYRTYKIKRLGLFGSYASGKPNKNSDIDFLVEFQKEADLMDQVGLKLELEKLTRKKVDVVTPRALSKYFRSKVLKEAVYL